ncbi:MAG: MFS transporter [bacterium]
MNLKSSKIINAWCLYDWANSAFATTIMAAVLPIFFREVATVDIDSSQQHLATSLWGYTASIAMLFVSVVSLLFGPVSDYSSSKKKFLKYFIILGVASTTLLTFTGFGTWKLVSLLFILGNIGFAGSEVFYNALLPHISPSDKIDQVSTRGYAFGYIGGGLLLSFNIAMIWLLPKTTLSWDHAEIPVLGMQLSFLSVAIWWGIFSFPILRHVPEPPGPSAILTLSDINPFKVAFKRLRNTFRHIKKYKQLFLFLIAFWLYNDGIGTIIKMATAYGNEIGIGTLDLVGALLLVQIIGVPCSFAFGRLAGIISTKKAILSGLMVYLILTIGAFFMTQTIHFWILAFMVGLVQGGTQGLSRSLYGSMVPLKKSAEFFSFYNISGKFAGIAGPAVFALTSQLFKSSRYGIISLIFFFITGAILLLRVDVEEGRKKAR